MRGTLRIDKDGVFINGRHIPNVKSVILGMTRDEARATLEVCVPVENVSVDLPDVDMQADV